MPDNNNQQDRKQQEQGRAHAILSLLIILLGVSSVIYVLAHTSMQNQRQQLNSIVDKNIEITQGEIASAKQLLEGDPSIDKLKEQLKKIEPSVNQIISQAENIPDATQKEKLTQAGEDIRALTQTIDNLSSLNPEQVRNYAIQFLTLAEKELKTIQKNEKDTSFFWGNPPLLWVEIAFWSWVGTILYLLSEIYTYYKADSEQQKFIEMTPWYFITLLRGTFIVFMILLGATTINVGFGQAVNFSDAPATLYVFLAGVLGYFNRMAKEQLIIIVQAVFPEAWDRANPKEIPAASAPTPLIIIPEITDLLYEGTATIKVESGQSVNWSASSNLGSFSQTPGIETVYTAPTENDAKDGAGSPVTQITITATSVDDSSQKGEMKVSLKTASSPLKITPEITEINYGQEETFKIESGQSVTWSANLGSFNPTQTTQGSETVYKAPTESEAKDGAGSPVTQITITATSVADSSQTAERTVRLKTAPASLTITPDKTELNYGEIANIKVEPEQPVNWSVDPPLGAFSPTSGAETVYTAPAENDAKDSAGSPVTQITIIATSVADSSQTATTIVRLKPISASLTITPDKTELNFGEIANIKVEPEQPVNWSVDPSLGAFSPTSGAETVYTAPAENDAKDSAGSPVTQITVIATSVADSSQIAEITVNLKAP